MGWQRFQRNNRRWHVSPAGICPGFARQCLYPWLCSQLPARLLSRRLSPIRSRPGLLRQGRDEVRPEAPGCSGERSLFLLTKGHNVGTTLLAAAIASSERHCTPNRGESVSGSFSRMSLPSNGRGNFHWALERHWLLFFSGKPVQRFRLHQRWHESFCSGHRLLRKGSRNECSRDSSNYFFNIFLSRSCRSQVLHP